MCFDSAQAKAVKIKYVFRQRPSQGCKNPIRLISSKHESLIIQLTKVPTGEEENEKKDNETAYNKQTNKQTNKQRQQQQQQQEDYYSKVLFNSQPIRSSR